ncbi:MAG: geranylgeranylglyceryl/heptaprenylglyceryl phosphate synthase, partial [Marinilabilia sp.]
MNIQSYIENNRQKNKKMLALLIDPDKCRDQALVTQAGLIEEFQPHLVLVGGSLTSHSVEYVVKYLKAHTSRPVVLYPGHPVQVSFSADALLFLSMISGRNPELLIGAHVTVAPAIRENGIETIPTGYILIDGGVPTSVEYMSQTRPVPAGKTDIAGATALDRPGRGPCRCTRGTCRQPGQAPVDECGSQEVYFTVLHEGRGLSRSFRLLERDCEKVRLAFGMIRAERRRAAAPAVQAVAQDRARRGAAA